MIQAQETQRGSQPLPDHSSGLTHVACRATATDVPTSTLELPLTPAHIAALRHHIRKERQWFLGLMSFGIAAGMLLPFSLGLSRSPSLSSVLGLLVYVAVLGLVMDWFFWRRPLASVIRKGTYLRATGPIRISTAGRNGATVYAGDVTISYVQSPMSLGLRDLPWGTIDCVPHVRAVIEQRDADGELLYRYAAYRPDPDPFEVRQMPSLVVGVLCGIGCSTVVTFCTFALVTWMK
jgi:hypothetical protein